MQIYKASLVMTRLNLHTYQTCVSVVICSVCAVLSVGSVHL